MNEAVEKLVLKQRICEEILSYGESNQEEPDLTFTLNRILLAFELAGYLPVEPVKLEELGVIGHDGVTDKLRHLTARLGAIAFLVDDNTIYGMINEIGHEIDEQIVKLESLNVAHNEAKFGQLYRRVG